MAVGAALFILAVFPSARAQEGCKAPEPVCAARSAVFGLSSAFDPYGSAVRIGSDLLVANRHSVADEKSVQIILSDGSKVAGNVVPTSFEADLVLIRAQLPPGPVLTPARAVKGDVFAVGIDISSWNIRVFPGGKVLRRPDASKPLSRLHHTAYNQPGVSGGALVDASGGFVGIVTSGGSRRFEAIPAGRVAELQKQSGGEFAARSAERGKAYRDCIVILEQARRASDVLPSDVAERMENVCLATGNRQLFDMAGQAIGRSRMFDKSIALFQRSLDIDPNAVNTRLGMVVILSFARRHAEARPHIRWLLEVIPEDVSVARYALQIGKATDDDALAQQGLALIEKFHPRQIEAARKFYESDARPPKRR